jgi:CO/xanthine dehydrogenase Mo-binding subunit
MAHDTSFTNQDFKIIGSRPIRPDGVDKVTGRAKYGADTFAPGQLVGRILRSPHAHAKIKNIDTSRAEKLKGVKAVITSKDLPDLTGGNRAISIFSKTAWHGTGRSTMAMPSLQSPPLTKRQREKR